MRSYNVPIALSFAGETLAQALSIQLAAEEEEEEEEEIPPPKPKISEDRWALRPGTPRPKSSHPALAFMPPKKEVGKPTKEGRVGENYDLRSSQRTFGSGNSHISAAIQRLFRLNIFIARLL